MIARWAAHREKPGGEEHHHQQDHHEPDDREAAPQRLGQRLRAGIHRRLRPAGPARAARRANGVGRSLPAVTCFSRLVETPRNRSNGGVLLIEHQGRALLERALQRVEPEQEAGQLGVLLEHRQRLRRLGLALALDLGRLRLARWPASPAPCGRLPSGSPAPRASPSYWKRSASTLRSEVIRSKTDWLTSRGSCRRLMPRNSTCRP